MEKRLPGAPRCPVCGALVDGVAPAGHTKASPEAGDVGICCTCGEPLVYNEVGSAGVVLRPLEPEERRRLASSSTEFRRVLQVVRQQIAQRQ